MSCPDRPEVATGELIQTDTDCYGTKRAPNGVGDTSIRNMCAHLPGGNSARIGSGPDRCSNTVAPGPIHAPSVPLSESEDPLIIPSSAGLTIADRRNKLISDLKRARRRYDAARSNRVDLIFAARELEVSCHDIGIALGITDTAVRGLMNRARRGDSR